MITLFPKEDQKISDRWITVPVDFLPMAFKAKAWELLGDERMDQGVVRVG